MTVAELIEKLQSLPGHITVHIPRAADGSGGGADTDYLFVDDIELTSFPTYGRIAVLTINQQPTDSSVVWSDL